MRYASGKRLALYVCKGNNKDYKRFKKMRGVIGNLTIEENVTLPPYCNELDSTFTWRRKALVDGKNRVFFHKDEWLHVISVKTQ